MERPDLGPAKTLGIAAILRPHLPSLALALVAALGEVATNLLDPWPLKIVLDDVLRSQHRHGWLNQLIYATTGNDNLVILKYAVAAILLIAVVGALCSYMQKYLTTSVGQWVMHDLRRTLYSHIQRLSLAYHDQKQTGDLVSRVTIDIDAIQSFIASGLLGVLVDLLTLVGMVGVMFYINWRFTLVALSVAPVLFAIVYSYTRRIKKAAREVRKQEGKMASIIEEVLSSIHVVRAFGREDYEQRRMEEQSLESVEAALHARSLKARLSPLVEIIVAVGTAMVLWFGARMEMAGALSVGSLILFIFYLGKMYKPMQDLSKMTDSFSKAAAGYERIREVMETDSLIRDRRGARQAPRFQGRIEFDRVSFAYQPGTPVLKNVSLRIEPGTVAALVGPTGAGKSTIISLIARFYDPDAGMIKIDDVDIRAFRQKSLRTQISFVLQDTLLFHAPIWQNIAYGKPEASRRELLRAAELANAHEFIEKLPEAYNTMVGERGVTLSGGQRQRIAIARAIIRDTPILIMDEPSSGLDAASEKMVFEALDRLMAGRTCIVIAHRLSTIRKAGVIFVVKDGSIAETGRHEELVKLGGVYARFHQIQFAAAEDDREALIGDFAG